MSAIAVVQGHQSVSQVRQARIGLAVYFAILIPLSLLWYILDQTHILNDHYALIMSTPAVSAILARLILREGIKDVSFQFGGKRGLTAVVFVVLFPLFLALLTYVPFWLFGWTQLNTKGLIFSGLSSQPVLDLILNALIFTVIGTLALIPAGFGEEFGWRGFMLTRLISAKVPWPIFVSGLIWGAWHLPFIIGGLYDTTSNPLLGSLIAMVAVSGYVYIISWARLYSGSVWPAVLAHAAFNIVYNDTFGAATKGGTYLLGETGIVTALVMAVIAIILYRVRPLTQPLLAPSQPMEEEDGSSQQQIAPGYLIVGLMLILAGVLDLLLNGYFITITCVLAGVGFLVYSFSKHKNSWKQRARWQQVLLIILLAVTAASFLTDLIYTFVVSLR
jgi:membrane protease YdiL (CAAX protease family)